MNSSIVRLFVIGIFSIALAVQSAPAAAQEQKRASSLPAVIPAGEPVFKHDDYLLQWPLPSDQDRVYGAIDGKKLHGYVVEQALMSRKYRDTVHPQFWGRLTGTSSDHESADWMIGKFKQFGLADVWAQPFDLPPQWFPDPWTVSASSGGEMIALENSATPAYGSVGTPPEGLDLEAVWVGTGAEADYIGRDVRGKAVFIYSTPLPGSMQHTAGEERAAFIAIEKGAAAVFQVIALPGNIRNILYPHRVKVPVFSLGMEDGYAVRDMIGKAAKGPAPRIKINMQTRMVPNLKTALVWGTLPGLTDETIYIIAHRDGWFDAATDNGSGVATLLGLAEYFAGIPKDKRQRTIVFVGLDGHHNDTTAGVAWMVENRAKLFGKTALMINAEHTSTLQTYLYGAQIRNTNAYAAQKWYAGGPSRPKLQNIAVEAFKKFGVSIYSEPEKGPPLGDLSRFRRFVPGVVVIEDNMYFHTDHETPEIAPWTGLEASTRAFAKIVDEVNKLPLADLQRPEEPAGERRCREPRGECFSSL